MIQAEWTLLARWFRRHSLESVIELQPNFYYQGLSDTKIGGTSTSNHSYRASMSVLRVPSQSELSHAFSQNSLHRSVSQLIDTHDKKSLGGGAWDADLHGTDSGMVRCVVEFVWCHKMYLQRHCCIANVSCCPYVAVCGWRWLCGGN